MKSITQITQLSDGELKAVLKKDRESFHELMDAAMDYDSLKRDLGDMAKNMMDRFSRAFQLMLEKMIGEEFMTFLDDIASNGISPSRNGYYERKVRSYLGDYTIQIPRARFENFETALLKKYGHEIGDIESKIVELYVGGMSESEVVSSLSSVMNIGISKEKVGEIVRKTVGKAMAFNMASIEDCPIVFLDATYVSMRRAYYGRNSIEKNGILVAMGVTPEGKKKVLGFLFGETESIDRWSELLRSLKARGLSNPRLFITDGLSGMPEAIRRFYPKAEHQRCVVHYMRNLMSYVGRKDRKAVAEDFRKVISNDTKDEARKAFMEFSAFWSAKYRGMTGMLDVTDDDVFTFYDFPKELRRSIYTSNAIEGFNSKLKRETRKRIQANSEDNATIIVTHISESYNRSCGLRLLNGLKDVDPAIRHELGFTY